MKVTSVKKNFLYQILYQIILYLIPLIVAPFLTRTLGSDNLGNYSYFNTITSYAGLIANLGIAIYGQRVIANCRDDSDKLNKTFWSLYLVHFVFSIIAFGCYFSCYFIFDIKDIFE